VRGTQSRATENSPENPVRVKKKKLHHERWIGSGREGEEKKDLVLTRLVKTIQIKKVSIQGNERKTETPEDEVGP